MRTTLSIDDDVLNAARQLADSTGESLGHALSELARSALTRTPSGGIRNSIRLLPVAEGVTVTLDDVNALRDELE